MKVKLIVLAIVCSLFAVTCRHEIPIDGKSGGDNPPVNSGACSADSIYFVNTILPLVSSGCAMSGCHDAVSHEEGLVLNSYAGIMKIVQPGNAGASKLYRVITTTDAGDFMPPPPHAPFSAASIAAIQKWINQGAKNNQCASACDTAVYTFSGAVQPVINTYCKGCHNPASMGGGIDLSTYAAIRTVALNGDLIGSIKHSPGFVAMPQGGNKLSECQIRQIEKWIQAGSANN